MSLDLTKNATYKVACNNRLYLDSINKLSDKIVNASSEISKICSNNLCKVSTLNKLGKQLAQVYDIDGLFKGITVASVVSLLPKDASYETKGALIVLTNKLVNAVSSNKITLDFAASELYYLESVFSNI